MTDELGRIRAQIERWRTRYLAEKTANEQLRSENQQLHASIDEIQTFVDFSALTRTDVARKD